MSFRCGIVGLPNVGKSTLFNALTNSSKAQAENFPFCTIEPNVGIVPVPDERLDKLAKISLYVSCFLANSILSEAKELNLASNFFCSLVNCDLTTEYKNPKLTRLNTNEVQT